MFRKSMFSLLAIVFAALLAAQVNAGGQNNYRLRANLTGPGLASGKAVYRERQRNNITEQRFSIEVEDATPGTIMTVAVNGTTVGMIVINDLGVGELEYRTPQFIDDPGDGDPIPDGFPHLIAGDAVTVGPLSGEFVSN